MTSYLDSKTQVGGTVYASLGGLNIDSILILSPRSLPLPGALWMAVRRIADPASTGSQRLPPLSITREVGRVAGLIMAVLAQVLIVRPNPLLN